MICPQLYVVRTAVSSIEWCPLFRVHFINRSHCTNFSPYLDDILTEDAILKWYQDAHITKGKREFISQMKYMIDWFNTAEEESEEEEANPEQLS